MPPLGQKSLLEVSELVLGCSKNVALAFLGNELDVVLTGYAAVHVCEPFSVRQSVDFDGHFDEDVVRGMEPVAELFDSPRHWKQ